MKAVKVVMEAAVLTRQPSQMSRILRICEAVASLLKCPRFNCKRVYS